MLDADVEVDRRDFRLRVAISVAPGERLALFGPSGAGKTTVLEAIAGLVTPRRGRIVLRGRVLTSTEPPARAVPPWQRRVGLLRQDPGLFPHLSVRGNLGYAPGAGRDEAALTEIAGRLEIGGLLPVMPARLSGGQAHRVALGRLLLADCDALLLDEPYTGLDAALRRTLTDLVIRLAEDRQVPTIMVAHELSEAQAFAHRMAVIDRGTLLQTGTPHDIVLHPASLRVAELVGYLGFVPLDVSPAPAGAASPPAARTTAATHNPLGALSATGLDSIADPGNTAPPANPADHASTPGHASGAGSPAGGAGTLAGGAPGRLVIAVHPDRVILGAHPGRGVVLTGTMIACRPAGAGWEGDLRVGQTPVTVRLPDRPLPEDGLLVLTALDPPCFAPDGTALP